MLFLPSDVRARDEGELRQASHSRPRRRGKVQPGDEVLSMRGERTLQQRLRRRKQIR